VIGSTMCAAAQTWGMLLFGRALQGLSAAGINNIVKIVLADKVTLAEQAKNTTVFSLVAGISFAVGPVIGGSLAVSNWRYCFVISIPVSLLAAVLIFLLLRKELIHGTHHLTGPESKSLLSGLSTIDVGGTLLFIFGAGLIILATSWGGTKYPWGSYQVLVPLVIGSILFLLFFIYEYLLEPGNWISRIFPKQVAMIPWTLFDRKDVISLAVINAATGASLYSAIYFVGLFWTLAENYSPQKAGYQLLYYTPGIGGEFQVFSATGRMLTRKKSWCLFRHVSLQRVSASDILPTVSRFHRRGRRFRCPCIRYIHAQPYACKHLSCHRGWRFRRALHAKHAARCWNLERQDCGSHVVDGLRSPLRWDASHCNHVFRLL